MATKSKNTNLSRGIFSWFCYLFTFWTVIFVTVFGCTVYMRYGSDFFNTANRAVKTGGYLLRGELRELNTYKESASQFFERLYFNTQASDSARTLRNAADGPYYGTPYLESVSKDNLYAVTDYSQDPGGITMTNDLNWDAETLPADFNYLFRCRNGVVEIFHGGWENGEPVLTCVFRSDEPGAFYTNTLSYTLEAMAGSAAPPDIVFAVRAQATSYYALNEIVGSAQSYANQLLFQLSLVGTAFLLFLLLMILGMIFRRDRRQFETNLAEALSHVWIEIKLAAVLCCLVLSALMIFASGAGELRSGIWVSIGLCVIFLMIHLILVDISHNRLIWRHNILRSVLRFIAGPKDGKSFEKIEYRKFIAVLVVLSVLGLSTLLITFFAWNRSPFFELLPIFYLAVLFAVVGTLLWYAAALRDDLRDYGILMDQVEQMYNGNLNAVNTLPAAPPLYSSAMQLNMIRDGIRIAVEDGIKSEKSKVELITNVSHDIKTPLTSIIGYVELLKAEENLPDHVQDYIAIIAQKSYRLRHMIQDIFDVSKAATGNITLDPEYLNLKILLQQTLADMHELMESSPLEWRVQIPEDQYPVYVDGQRMYRVFQNLVKNAAQYALEGSRVYLTLVKQQDQAVFSMQNVSKHELPADGETLTGRFVRGDDSRSTSGSGLGLSIAKSFTEACGGTLRIQVQGDLFTVEITLPLAAPPAPAEDPDQTDPENP